MTLATWLLLAAAAPEAGRSPSPDRPALVADLRVPGARLGRESAHLLVPPPRGHAIAVGSKQDSLRATPWIGPATMAQLMMHESAHALIPFLRGDDTVHVRFFPDVGAGRFGEATWSRDGPHAYDALTSAMPKILDLALMAAAGRAKRSVRTGWGRGLLGALQIVALGDFLQGTLTIWRPPGRWNDAWYLTQCLDQEGVHLGKGGARAAMTTLAVAGVGLFAATW